MCIGKISVGVVKFPVAGAENIYIGRGQFQGKSSPLANPWIINASQSRDCVCDWYEEYIMEQLNSTEDNAVRDEFNRIAGLLLAGKDVNLLCYCKYPGRDSTRCHGDYIKEVIDDAITHDVLGDNK